VNLDELVEREMKASIEVPRTYAREIDYENKLVLAPMVRTGSSECFDVRRVGVGRHDG
jgi:hypothetical protein